LGFLKCLGGKVTSRSCSNNCDLKGLQWFSWQVSRLNSTARSRVLTYETI